MKKLVSLIALFGLSLSLALISPSRSSADEGDAKKPSKTQKGKGDKAKTGSTDKKDDGKKKDSAPAGGW